MAPSVYDKLFEAFKKRYASEHSKEQIQKQCNECWKDLKSKHRKKSDLEQATEEKIQGLLVDATRISAGLLNYFAKVAKKPQSSPSASSSLEGPGDAPGGSAAAPPVSSDGGPQPVIVSDSDDPSVLQDDATESPVKEITKKRGSSAPLVFSSDEEDDHTESGLASSFSRVYKTPAQDSLKAKISVLEKQLIAAVELRDSGLGDASTQKKIENLKTEIAKTKQVLSSKQAKAKRQKKYHAQRRETLQVLRLENPQLAKALHIRENPGRPRLEEDQPELLRVIAEIAMFGGAADGRRRSELVRTCKTLEDLTNELKNMGFQLCKSATYLRLLPRNSHTAEGKRHVTTVPVKLCRAQADARKDHIDGKFCTASIRSVQKVVSILGSQQVAVLSQDDKSRVPIGLAAANKQAPFLMHLEYRVRLQDHDFVLAPQHKLIPSVYAGLKIKEGKIGDPTCLTYSGPTYVTIRSAKHSSSTAATHAYDFTKLIQLEEFREIFYVGAEVKPVLVIMSDGGPDENPRYKKVIAFAIQHFKDLNLDALFLITNAPGRSAYNPVERRMAYLSYELAGVVLPHDKFGSHLNDSGKTINSELEVKNFEFAGETLADVWNKLVLDGYPVNAEYTPPGCEANDPSPVSEDWYSSHVQGSQYFLQIVKCSDRDCCSDWRSNLRDVFPLTGGFIPPPFPLRRAPEGLSVPPPEDTTENDTFPDLCLRQTIGLKPVTDTGFPVPYDYYCPSVRDQIPGRTCSHCGAYFASKVQRDLHVKGLHKSENRAKKQRASKVLRRRSKELLCILENYSLATEPEVVWMEESDVDVESEISLQTEAEESVIDVISDIHEWLVSPWTQDN